MEVGSLPEKEFKVMAIKTKELRRMGGYSEKWEVFNCVKKCKEELNRHEDTVAEMNNALEGISGRVSGAEG